MRAIPFDRFFETAVGYPPFPFQRDFAESLPQLVCVPTGLGKTAMGVIAWLWRRFGGDQKRKAATPRRLVYCLPMRVLVEQTAQQAKLWIRNLNDSGALGQDVSVHVLMGGEEADEWDLYPEREAVIIGTQDMLISRALNRGYAASRARWPIQFGLLHTDCLWIFDEIQLMGSGLATTTQLEALRRKLPSADSPHAKDGNGCSSVWMSATMRREWLKTVDFASFLVNARDLTFEFAKEIKRDGLNEGARHTLEDRWNAKKPLGKAASAIGDAARLAHEVRKAHKPGTRTIVVLNTVKRACELFDVLKVGESGGAKPNLVLLHSRFRPEDRKKQVDEALAEIRPDEPGTIVVSTQVIEAGVDVSSTTLFTEAAPWASLVQRFGRCNRRGEDNGAQVFWIDLPGKRPDAEKMAPPYEFDDLHKSAKRLENLEDVGLKSLPLVELQYEHTHVIRRKDLIDLFDTTPDLAGNDIDIDRFVREVEDSEDSDVRAFWRDWERPKGYESPPDDQPTPRREELCAARIGEFRDFTKKHKDMVWRWSFLDKKWEKAGVDKIAPGQVFLVHANAGGYSAERGWDPGTDDRVEPIDPPAGTAGDAPDATEDERLSRIGVWQTIAEHAEDVCAQLDGIAKAPSITGAEVEALRHAARWHDRGKAHEIFQDAIDDGQVVKTNGKEVKRRERPEVWRGCRMVAKAPDKQKDKDGKLVDRGFWRVRPYARKHFRHELASALAVLDPRNDRIPEDLRDLVAYLVAAHHGKVRLSIRSLPNESRPEGDRRFARGVWDDDKLLATDLGGGVIAPAVTLSLEPMELGLCEHEPFVGQPSWADRMLRLRDALGPFRLAYLEAVLIAADRRASRKAEEVASDRVEGDTRSHEMERGDPALAQPAGKRAGEDPPRPHPESGGAEHGVRGRAGGSGDAGEGTHPPESATRHIETALGIISYSELAPHLARSVLALQDDIQSGRYADRPLDEGLVLDLHARIAGDLIPQIGGRWRTRDVRVGSHTPPPFHQVQGLVREYARDLQTRLDSLPDLPDERLFEHLAFADWRLLWIHPFEDFNGRVTRVFLVEILRRLDLPAVDTTPRPGIETQRYLDALRAADHGDLAPLALLWRDRFEREDVP